MHLFKNAPIYELQEFVKRSTIADTKEDVARFLLSFLVEYETSETIQQFVKEILHDDELLNKITIVSEHELYETVVMMTNTQTKDIECMNQYKENAETIFLHVLIDEKEEDEIKGWQEKYEQNKADIVNLILDECLLLKKMYHFTQRQHYLSKIITWQHVLQTILANEKDR